MSEAGHWERTYRERGAEDVSWFEASPAASLAAIEASGCPLDAAIVDVGGGASRLAGALVDQGFEDVTVVDLSEAGLELARNELGARADRVRWVVGDVRELDLGRRFDLWHDRAVFHFMVEPADRDAYVDALRRSVASGGQVILATFGPEGPERCSGLPVQRYGSDELLTALGPGFELLHAETRNHTTPGGGVQQFLWARLQRG